MTLQRSSRLIAHLIPHWFGEQIAMLTDWVLGWRKPYSEHKSLSGKEGCPGRFGDKDSVAPPPHFPQESKVPEITRDINDKNRQVKHSLLAQTNDPFRAGFGD